MPQGYMHIQLTVKVINPRSLKMMNAKTIRRIHAKIPIGINAGLVINLNYPFIAVDVHYTIFLEHRHQPNRIRRQIRNSVFGYKIKIFINRQHIFYNPIACRSAYHRRTDTLKTPVLFRTDKEIPLQQRGKRFLTSTSVSK